MLSGFCFPWFVVVFVFTGCAPYSALKPEDTRPLTASKIRETWEARSGGTQEGPLTLERAIKEALSVSPELHQIRERLASAWEQVRQAEAQFYPRLIFSQEFSITDNPVFAFMQMLHQRKLSFATDFNDPPVHQGVTSRIQGEWSLFEGGGRIYRRRAFLNSVESVSSELLAAKNRLVATVVEAYLRWLQSLAFLEVAQRAVALARVDQELGEARVRAETALPSEVLRLKARTAEAEANEVSAKASARRLQAALERLLARPLQPHEIPSYKDVTGDDKVPPQVGDPEELIEKALAQRPELQAVRYLAAAAMERVKEARSELLPKVGARAWYAWDSEGLKGGGQSWLASFQATLPLFQGGLTLSRIREAASRLREIQARGQQVALDVALEVHQALASLQEAKGKTLLASRRREYAQKALDETRAQYRMEVVTVDALLNAELEWNRAEVSYAASLFEERIAYYALMQALGELARSVEEAP